MEDTAQDRRTWKISGLREEQERGSEGKQLLDMLPEQTVVTLGKASYAEEVSVRY